MLLLQSMDAINNVLSTLVFVAISVLMFRYIQWHWSRKELYKAASKFNGPKCLPFIGNAIFVTRFVNDFFMSTPVLLKKYGKSIRVWLGPQLLISVNDPVDVELLFNSPANVERGTSFMAYAEILGNGLVTCPSSIWKAHRKLIQPTMAQQILDTFVETFAAQSKVLADNLMEDLGKKCDIFDRVFKCTLDSICETSMGIKMNSQSQENIYGRGLQRYLEIAFIRMYNVWMQPNVLFKLTSHYKVLQELDVVLRQFSDNIIQIKREERRVRKLERTESEDAIMTDTGIRKKTFMEMLLDIADDGNVFTDKDISDETATMIAAGSDTTASGDCFIILCLALHPEIQERVYEEVVEQIGQDRLVEKRDLAHFKYLELVIKESLRLFPILPYIGRECHQDVKLNDDVVIPGGAIAAVFIYDIHHNERYWKEPKKFVPERFLAEHVAKRHPNTYLAFGAGSRNCIGRAYAMMSIKTTIAILARKYKFYTDYKSVEDVKLKIEGAFTKPIEGYKIRFELRN